MSLKHGLLGLLSCGGPTTGYELDKFFKHSLAYFWQAKTSHIYRELSAMESQGWLTSERVFQEEKPNKRVYSLTDAGKAELLNWLCLPDSSGGVKSAFLMRIFFSGEVGGSQALKLIHEYRDRCIALLPDISQVKETITQREAVYSKHVTYWKLTALHGEISLRAGIEWANMAIEILEENVCQQTVKEE